MAADNGEDIFMGLIGDMERVKIRLAQWSDAIATAEARLACAAHKLELDSESA